MAKAATRRRRSRDIRDADVSGNVSLAVARAIVKAAGMPDEIQLPRQVDPSSPAASNRITVRAPSERLTPRLTTVGLA